MSASLRHALERRKREVCVAPLFPGSPDDYRYVPESCRKKVPSGTGRTGNSRRVRMEQELTEVRAWLAAHPLPRAPPPVNLANAVTNVAFARRGLKMAADMTNMMLNAVQACFAHVVDPAERRRQPSALARLEQALPGSVPEVYRRNHERVLHKIRHGVMTMMEAHLRSALAR